MSQNEEKTAEELAYCVKSDMDIENIVGKFKHDLQELDYRNLLAHPQEKINERALKMACETLLSEEFIRRIEGISLWLLSLPPAQQQELVDRLTS